MSAPSSPYRSMSDVAAAESDATTETNQPCVSRDHDEQFTLVDRVTGKLLANARYRIEGLGVLVEGRTDPQGRTQRIHTAGQARRLRVHQIPEDVELSADSADADGCL